ncbi:MAG: hypothetical protein WC444_01945 [Candidatus Paceibacterota bacterium]
MKKLLSPRVLISVLLVAVPSVVFAAAGDVTGAAAATPAAVTNIATGIGTFAVLVTLFTTTVVKAVGTLLLAAALVVFFFGIVQYIWGAREGKADKVKIGNQFMGWGLLALFVMFSVYGIIKFGQGILFSGSDVTTIKIPSFDFGGASSGIAPSGGALVNPSAAGTNACTGKADGSTCGTGGRCVSQNCAGGTSSVVPAAGGTVSAAQSAYNTCIGNNGTDASCQSAYQSAGGTGSAAQNLASQAYNSCLTNGNSSAECQTAYAAYGGIGSAQENLTNTVYTNCMTNTGGDMATCQTAAQAAMTGNGPATVTYAQCVTNNPGLEDLCAASTGVTPPASGTVGPTLPSSDFSASCDFGMVVGSNGTCVTEAAQMQEINSSVSDPAADTSAGGTTPPATDGVYLDPSIIMI